MQYKKYLRWRTTDLQKRNGVLVGADITQEWLLPWWWKNYRAHNRYPVSFVDFGMSFEMKEWCQKHGEWIPLRMLDDFVKGKGEVDPNIDSSLEDEFGKHFWECRSAWFKKPFACLQTPYLRTVWIDLDCEVRGSIQSLFEHSFGLAKDQCDILENASYPIYNSGVIVFERNFDVILDWARTCVKTNHLFRGDQEVLSWMIAEKKIPLFELPRLYNLSRTQKGKAVILHWHGVYGKRIIKTQINAEKILSILR